jgi:hypothetical protein
MTPYKTYGSGFGFSFAKLIISCSHLVRNGTKRKQRKSNINSFYGTMAIFQEITKMRTLEDLM